MLLVDALESHADRLARGLSWLERELPKRSPMLTGAWQTFGGYLFSSVWADVRGSSGAGAGAGASLVLDAGVGGREARVLARLRAAVEAFMARYAPQLPPATLAQGPHKFREASNRAVLYGVDGNDMDVDAMMSPRSVHTLFKNSRPLHAGGPDSRSESDDTDAELMRSGDDGPASSSGVISSFRRSRKNVFMTPLPLTAMAPRGLSFKGKGGSGGAPAAAAAAAAACASASARRRTSAKAAETCTRPGSELLSILAVVFTVSPKML